MTLSSSLRICWLALSSLSLVWFASSVLSAQVAVSSWAEQTYANMTPEERVGQLIMIRAHSDLGQEHVDEVEELIRKYHVGAACFFQGNPEEQVRRINRFQRLSKLPMLMAMDAEWGLGMRMKKHVLHYPHQMALGAVQDDKLIYDMGQEIARQLLRVGIHLNFAPVVDVNNNALNPVINFRSFGESPEEVGRRATAYMKGMQSQGLLTCAKHFPGHGDTDTDSHYDLPIIPHDSDRLNRIELAPFKKLIREGVDAIMVAHLQVPAIDSQAHIPTTLSPRAVQDLLIDSLGYQGLVISDAMEMKGVTKHHPPGSAELKAILAGQDMLCLPADVPRAVDTLTSALQDGRLSEARLKRSVLKILELKYRAGLTAHIPIPVENISDILFSPNATFTQKSVTAGTITTVRNRGELLPLTDLDSTIAILQIGDEVDATFADHLKSYASFKSYRIKNAQDLSKYLVAIRRHGIVVAAFHGSSQRASKKYGLNEQLIRRIARELRDQQLIAAVFANAYAVKYFDDYNHIIMGYGSRPSISRAMSDAIMGVQPTSGHLPITASAAFPQGMGVPTQPIFRLADGLPEYVGMSSSLLSQVDSLMKEAIEDKATPGGQILVIKDGMVIYDKSFGHHTYNKKRSVRSSDLYDVASLTKVLATTLSIMHLFEQSKINIFRKVRDYIPESDTTAMGDVTIEELLTHRAGFKPWIPFYRETLNTASKPDKKWYRTQSASPYDTQVAEGLYIHRSYYADSMWTKIVHAEMPNQGRYVYSDLGFYVLDEIIKRVSGLTVDQYASKHFYEPMGLTNVTYCPLKKFNKDVIAPSEFDKYFRQQRIQGHVHDMGAAMKGGISGHAGLFANSRSVGALMQMLLYGGYYGGRRYLDPYTISLFTVRPERHTRRGLGFDMKQLDPTAYENMTVEASHRTFGHLGFTGTAAWADPIHNVIFVFLSNRTYPTIENKKLIRDNYRPRIQQAIYRSIVGYGVTP